MDHNAYEVVRRLVLEKGPISSVQLCQALNLEYVYVTNALRKLLVAQKVIYVGHAQDLGLTGARRDAYVWAKPGTAKLVALYLDGSRIMCARCGKDHCERDQHRTACRCVACGGRFHVGVQLARAEGKRQVHPERIAGTITIGRGARWPIARSTPQRG